MNRTAAVLLLLSTVMFVGGVALYSPRLSVLVAGLIILFVGLSALDVKDRK